MKEQSGESASSWQRELERLDILEPSRVRLWRDEFLRLCLEVDGVTQYQDVTPSRLFPVSARVNYVSFLDSERREVVLLRDPQRLDAQSRQVLEAELTRTYFRPRILAVRDIEDHHGVARWEVQTDHGPRVFEIRDREDVRVLRSGRVLLQDADGNRFEIPDLARLDRRSRRLIDSEI